MWKHGTMRTIKYNYTYGTFVEVLGHYADLWRGNKKVLKNCLGCDRDGALKGAN